MACLLLKDSNAIQKYSRSKVRYKNTHLREKKKMNRTKHTNNLKKFSLGKNRRKLCLLPPRLDKAPSVSEDLTGFKTTLQSEVLGNRMLYDMLITSIVQEPVN